LPSTKEHTFFYHVEDVLIIIYAMVSAVTEQIAINMLIVSLLGMKHVRTSIVTTLRTLAEKKQVRTDGIDKGRSDCLPSTNTGLSLSLSPSLSSLPR
jgi:hypothetical protein